MLNVFSRRTARQGPQATRGFFDYLAVSSGQVPATKQSATGGAAKTEEKKHFSWDFIEWYRPYFGQFVGEMDKLKAFVNSVENKAREPARPYSTVNFDEWQAKIKDPTFVNELRAEYEAQMDIAKSFKDPYQHFSWSPEAQKELAQARREKYREFGLTPPEPQDEPKSKEAIDEGFAVTQANGQSLDEYYEKIGKEYQLDYEQIEAERDMFGVKGEMMDFALHPQIAEQIEETQAGKQTYVDKVLWEYEYQRYTKRERLMQLQDEVQRQAFLERWKHAARIHGADAGIEVGHMPMVNPVKSIIFA